MDVRRVRIFRATLVVIPLVAAAWLWTVWIALEIKLVPTTVEAPYTDERLAILQLCELFTWAGIFSVIVCPAAAWLLRRQGTLTPSRLRKVIRVVFVLTAVCVAAYLTFFHSPRAPRYSLWVVFGLNALLTTLVAFFLTFPFIWLWLRVALGPWRPSKRRHA